MSDLREELEKNMSGVSDDLKVAEEQPPTEQQTAVEQQPPTEQQTATEQQPPTEQQVDKQKEEVPQLLEALKAPNFWKPEAKAHWDKLPKEVQQEALRREREMDAAMSKTTQARQFKEQFDAMVTPHLNTFKAEGVDPVTGVNNLLAFASTMRSGTPSQRATLVKELIEAYEVDIPMLDQLLSGQVAPETKVKGDLERILEERLKPVHDLLSTVERAKADRARQNEARAAAEIERFASSAPYFDAVAEDVADILEMASSRNQSMTIEQAYERAVAMNPEVSKAVAAFKSRSSGPSPEQLAAGSSVRGSPTGGPAKLPEDLRGQLEHAFEVHSSR